MRPTSSKPTARGVTALTADVSPPAALPPQGQSAADLLKKLEGYKDGSFGAQRKLVMENVVKQLSDEQLKSLADYASTL